MAAPTWNLSIALHQNADSLSLTLVPYFWRNSICFSRQLEWNLSWSTELDITINWIIMYFMTFLTSISDNGDLSLKILGGKVWLSLPLYPHRCLCRSRHIRCTLHTLASEWVKAVVHPGMWDRSWTTLQGTCLWRYLILSTRFQISVHRALVYKTASYIIHRLGPPHGKHSVNWQMNSPDSLFRKCKFSLKPTG